MKKLFLWLAEKDKSNTLFKAGFRAAQLYRWAGDLNGARRIEDFCRECSEKNDEKNQNKT